MAEIGGKLGGRAESGRVDVGIGRDELPDIGRSEIDRHSAGTKRIEDLLGDIVGRDRILQRQAETVSPYRLDLCLRAEIGTFDLSRGAMAAIGIDLDVPAKLGQNAPRPLRSVLAD